MATFEEQEYNKPFTLSVWKKMLPFAYPYRYALLMVVIINLCAAVIDVFFPLYQKYAVDSFILNNTLDGLPAFVLAYLLTITVQTVGTILFARQAMKIEMYAGRDMKRACFVHLQTLSFSYYNVTPVGYLLARVMSDTSRISGTIAWDLTEVLWAGTYVIGAFVSMFLLSPSLAALILLVVPAIAVITVYFQKRILKWNRKIRKINSQITSALNEGITGAKTSKTMVIEDANLQSFSKLTDNMYHTTLRTQIINSIYIPLVMFFSSMAVALVLARGGRLTMEQLLDLGTLSAVISYAIGIFEPIQQIVRIFTNLVAVQANVERVTGLLEQTSEIKELPEVVEKYGDSLHPKPENWEPITGEIEFEDVSFKYPDGNEYVLEHFNLKIPAGTTIAIVGETGAGKSTLVNLACRFFEPTSGRILIDGKDYRERSQLWLHSNIGYVLQNPHLFSGTIRDNILYGRLDATEEEIQAAAKSVSADTVVNKLEQGYESDVGEGGDKLSTGEKQLISFARAVLANPRIFVLDEATSSIDTQTELLIQNAISHLLENRTSFLIAHRLSTIRQADLILVVKNGKIIERGSHKELMQQKGYYHSLYSKQFEEEAAIRSMQRGC